MTVVCVVADWPSVWCAVVFCVHQISEEYWCSGLNMDRWAVLDPHYAACKEIVKPPSVYKNLIISGLQCKLV